MKKLVTLLGLVALFCFIQGCASFGSSGHSVIVIQNGNTDDDNQYRFYIDGKVKGVIKNGDSKTFTVSNGYHTIRSEWRIMRYYTTGAKAGWDPWETNSSVNFELNNERIIISAEALWIEERTSLANQRPERVTTINTKSIKRDAITLSFNTLNPLISTGSRIAILGITPNNDDTLFVQEELMVLFVNAQKFRVVDRQTLETIRQEQRFQMTGEVSDDSAISIGQFLGADVVITGSISGNRSQRRLRLRALDVKTAQVLAMSSESI